MFVSLPNKRISSWDEFKMPVVNLDLKRSYKELANLKFTNQMPQEYMINKMEERTILKITRFGVRLET